MAFYEKPKGNKGDKRRIEESGKPTRRDKARGRDEERARTQDEYQRARFGDKGKRQGEAPSARSGGRDSGKPNGTTRVRDRRSAPPPPPVTPAEPFAPEEALPRENLLVGRNPIREAIKSGRDIEKLLVAKGELSGSAKEIVMKARERRIVVQMVDRSRLDAIAENHQGMLAWVSAFQYRTVEDMLALAQEREQPPFLVLLDGVTDPHNLGAVIRTAECAGAHGVIIPERRAVGLTPAAVKASAGAVEYVPVARTQNLVRQIDELKAQGIWVYGATMEGARWDKVDLNGPVALVIGGEGEGVSRLALQHCDAQVALPLMGKIGSLNASVAAGVLMYEVLRRRLEG